MKHSSQISGERGLGFGRLSCPSPIRPVLELQCPGAQLAVAEPPRPLLATPLDGQLWSVLCGRRGVGIPSSPPAGDAGSCHSSPVQSAGAPKDLCLFLFAFSCWKERTPTAPVSEVCGSWAGWGRIQRRGREPGLLGTLQHREGIGVGA